MSDISIVQAHNKELDEIRDLINDVAGKMEQRYELKASWLNETELKLHRQGLSGSIRLLEREVVIKIKLGLLMRPLRTTIHNAVAKAVAEKLAE